MLRSSPNAYDIWNNEVGYWLSKQISLSGDIKEQSTKLASELYNLHMRAEYEFTVFGKSSTLKNIISGSVKLLNLISGKNFTSWFTEINNTIIEFGGFIARNDDTLNKIEFDELVGLVKFMVERYAQHYVYTKLSFAIDALREGKCDDSEIKSKFKNAMMLVATLLACVDSTNASSYISNVIKFGEETFKS